MLRRVRAPSRPGAPIVGSDVRRLGGLGTCRRSSLLVSRRLCVPVSPSTRLRRVAWVGGCGCLAGFPPRFSSGVFLGCFPPLLAADSPTGEHAGRTRRRRGGQPPPLPGPGVINLVSVGLFPSIGTHVPQPSSASGTLRPHDTPRRGFTPSVLAGARRWIHPRVPRGTRRDVGVRGRAPRRAPRGFLLPSLVFVRTRGNVEPAGETPRSATSDSSLPSTLLSACAPHTAP